MTGPKGIILARIYQDQAPNQTQILHMVAEDIPLYTGTSQGFGKFIRDWFFNHFQQVFTTHKQLYIDHYKPLKEKTERIAQLLVNNEKKAAYEEYKNLRKIITALNSVYIAFVSKAKVILSSSESDDSFEAEMRKNLMLNRIEDGQITAHELKKIHRFLKQYYNPDSVSLSLGKCEEFDRRKK